MNKKWISFINNNCKNYVDTEDILDIIISDNKLIDKLQSKKFCTIILQNGENFDAVLSNKHIKIFEKVKKERGQSDGKSKNIS